MYNTKFQYSKYIKNNNSVRKRTRWIGISQNNTPCENVSFTHSHKKGKFNPNEIPFYLSVENISDWLYLVMTR